MARAYNLTTLARAQAEWGAYWIRCAFNHPEYWAACHHNAAMCALEVMVLEACA